MNAIYTTSIAMARISNRQAAPKPWIYLIRRRGPSIFSRLRDLWIDILLRTTTNEPRHNGSHDRYRHENKPDQRALHASRKAVDVSMEGFGTLSDSTEESLTLW